ncbi:hypothetical protein [Persicobacter psychrovividus]|uniref:Glucose transporter n=1 Tax=Persicobacter psychrovividus TaxID=387638 RepID=A0ABN6LB81_9BACT|nr:glucose transporter [Persicobacter psychrovividus]
MAEVMTKENKQTKETNYTGPFMIMVGLFFIVGFLTVVNQQFQAPLKEAFLSDAGSLKNTLTTLLTFAFFMGFPTMGNISSRWAEAFGYKNTLIRGLIMLLVGLAVFVSSALAGLDMGSMAFGAASVPYAYFIFLIGSYILGCSIATLQVVINPYLAVCQVPGTSSVTRMSIGGSSNSIGTTIAPLFVTYLVFGNVAPTVDKVISPFFVLIAVVAVVAFLVSRLNLPEVASSASEGGEVAKLKNSVWSYRHLVLGVVGIFVYVGAEVCIGANINLYAENLGKIGAISKTTDFLFWKELAVPSLMASLYWGGMLVGRLCGSFLSKISGSVQLTATTIIAIVLIVTAMLTSNPWYLVGVGLVHSVMWGAIFSLAIDKLGVYTSKGSGALMIGVAGGAILPWVQGIFADALGGWSMTWVLVIACEVYLLFYALVGHKHNFTKEITE